MYVKFFDDLKEFIFICIVIIDWFIVMYRIYFVININIKEEKDKWGKIERWLYKEMFLVKFISISIYVYFSLFIFVFIFFDLKY